MLGLEGTATLAEQVADGTFGQHLKEVRQRSLFPAAWSTPLEAIADETNRARNNLLHWKGPQHRRQGVYKGKDITTEEGLNVCLDDVITFVSTTPLSVT